MSKELRKMLQRLEQMKQEVRSFLGEDKTDEAEKRMNDVRDLQKKIEVRKALEEGEEETLPSGTPVEGSEKREDAELEQEYTGIFLRALRRRPVTTEQRSIITEYEQRYAIRAVMNEGGTDPAIPDGDSSLVVPQDIQTRINTVMRQFNDLSQYVNVQNVRTLSGSRVLEQDATMVPFALVDEYGEIQETDNPKFKPISYAVKKRAGILPLTNELLTDSDQNLIGYVTDWIGRKAVVTRNTLIVNLLNTLQKESLADITDIKRVMNVGLDPAISQSSILLTNQDGYQWLDEQVDAMGRYFLQDDITQPGRKLFKGRQIVVLSNRYLPSDTVGQKAPLVIGNLQQLIVLFNRKFFELASTKVGGDAWRRDTTELRTIMRDDIKLWDDKAAVFGQLDIS